jgi:hypothetical protein
MGEVGGQLRRWDDTKIKGRRQLAGRDRASPRRMLRVHPSGVALLAHLRFHPALRDPTHPKPHRTEEGSHFPDRHHPGRFGTAPWLASLNLRPPNGTPLSKYGQAERDEVMVEISKEIREILRQEVDSGQPQLGLPANRELPSSESPASARRIRRNDVRRRRQQIEDLIGDDKIDLALKRLIDFADDFCPARRREAVALKTKHRLSMRGDSGAPLALAQIDAIMDMAVLPALSMLSMIEEQLSAR